VREFETGATRDTDQGKIDPEGFISPLVIARYCEYMNENRVQADGNVRDSDNWQKGIPEDAYMKSKWRHFLDTWLHHRGLGDMAVTDLERALCAELFNTMGYLHTILEAKRRNGVADHARAGARDFDRPDTNLTAAGDDKAPTSETLSRSAQARKWGRQSYGQVGVYSG
jgi:hypothetical protein